MNSRATCPPASVAVTNANGDVTTRSVTLPPWLQIINWPGGGGSQNPDLPGSGGVSSCTTGPGAMMGPFTHTFPKYVLPEPSAWFPCPHSRQYVA